MAPAKRYALNRTDSMQRLQLLSSQQEVLQRRISLQVPTPAPFTASSPEYRSLSSSPTTTRYSSGSWSPELDNNRSTEPISAQPGVAHPHSVDAQSHLDDAHKLREINEQIKATLTELLNTDSVRADVEMRAWIQERLMDVEQQIRKQRRRHSSGDRRFAQRIAMAMSPESSF